MPSKQTSHLVLNLSEIVVDYDWNSRSPARAKFMGAHKDGVETSEDADPEAPGIEGLARSIELAGQDTPVDVVIPVDGPNKGKKMLAAGFRRFTAVKFLSEQKVPSAVPGLKPAQINAKVQEGLTEMEIRQLNLRENVRDQLPASDIAYGIGKLVELNPKISQKEIADVMGKSVAHVSKLHSIVTGLKPSIFSDWRTGAAKPLSVETIGTIAALDKAKQDAAYKEALAARDTVKAAKEADPNAWTAAAVDRAYDLGVQVGTLDRLGVVHGYNAEKVTVDGEDRDGVGMSGQLVTEVVKCKTQLVVVDANGKPTLDDKGKPVKKPVTAKTLNAIARAFDKGFVEGQKEPEADGEEEEGEEEEGD